LSFGSPYLLLSLLVVPAAAVGYLLVERRRRARAATWSNPDLLPNLIARRASRYRHIPVVFFLLGLTLLLVGFARPRHDLGKSHQGAVTVVVALDVSGSMAATDLGGSRLDAARRLATQLLEGLPAGDRVGIVTFATSVRLAQSPTLDRSAVLAALPKAVTPRSGTRIGDGIDQAVSAVVDAVGKSYPGSPVHPGVVVLLSDGAQTAGGPPPSQAANTAYLDGIPIDSVAFGTAGGEVKQSVLVGNRSVPITIDVPVYATDLQAASHVSGGSSYAVSSPAGVARASTALSSSYRRLSSTVLPAERRHALSTLTAAIALVLVAAGVVLAAAWFGSAA
jgi:Ca-activated chloride channel homolog